MITLMSWGHKYGQPNANYKFDVSYFANPWRDKEIKEEKDAFKRKELVMKFMNDQEGVALYVDRICSILRLMHLLYPEENHVVAFCCSAGEYRSPVFAELVGKHLKEINLEHKIIHTSNSKI